MNSTLVLKKLDFKVKTALYLGWGRGSDYSETAWTSRQDADLQEFVDSALRQFYFPFLEGGETYDWGFLKPTATVTLKSGDSTVLLPDDCGGVMGKLTATVSGESSGVSLDFGPIGDVYQKHHDLPEATGWPEICCVEPVKGTTYVSGQRHQIKVWPIADQAYVLNFQYYLVPDALSDASPYAYGGPAHTETILEGCLAMAEQRRDDLKGLHTQNFQERLKASIAMDRKLKPRQLGYCGDSSDYGRTRFWLHRPVTVTFNGVAYP